MCPENSPEPDIDEASEYSLYKNSSDKAEDNRSSAVIFLSFGALGIIFVILGASGILPLNIGNPYMFYGIMSALFILFIVLGAVSMKYAKLFAKKAVSENTVQDALAKWSSENLTAESVDREINDSDECSEEILYFKRYDYIKKRLNAQFMNLDQAMLDKIIDEKLYPEIFDTEGQET